MPTTYAPQQTKNIRIPKTELRDTEVIGRVLVKPGNMAKLVVGMYENTMPTPSLHVEFESGSKETLDASLFKFDEDDHYTLVYQFQNYGENPCRVTVRSE